MAQESIGFQIGGINNQITDEFGADNDLEVTGGGRGWTARTTISGVVHSATGTTKLGAAEALYQQIADADLIEQTDLEDDRKADIEEQLDFEDMTEGEAAQCVAECVTSIRPFCECRCQGRNHGAATGAVAPTLLGEKPCKCGCGQTTNRLFVPGHDARYHGLMKLREWWDRSDHDGPFNEEQARKEKAAAMRKAARERRATKRAEVAAKAEAVAKTIQPKRKSATVKDLSKVMANNRKQRAESPRVSIDNVHNDDLPF